MSWTIPKIVTFCESWLRQKERETKQAITHSVRTETEQTTARTEIVKQNTINTRVWVNTPVIYLSGFLMHNNVQFTSSRRLFNARLFCGDIVKTRMKKRFPSGTKESIAIVIPPTTLNYMGGCLLNTETSAKFIGFAFYQYLPIWFSSGCKPVKDLWC